MHHDTNAYNCVYATENLDLDTECELCPVVPPEGELGGNLVGPDVQGVDEIPEKVLATLDETARMFTIPVLVQHRVLPTQQVSEDYQSLARRLVVEMPEGSSRDEALRLLGLSYAVMVRGMSLD